MNTRLFTVKTDSRERYKIINAITRLRQMRELGRYDKPWQVASTNRLIAHYEQRLRQL